MFNHNMFNLTYSMQHVKLSTFLEHQVFRDPALQERAAFVSTSNVLRFLAAGLQGSNSKFNSSDIVALRLVNTTSNRYKMIGNTDLNFYQLSAVYTAS